MTFLQRHLRDAKNWTTWRAERLWPRLSPVRRRREKQMTNKTDDRSWKVRLTHQKGRKNPQKSKTRTEGAEGALQSTFKAASTGFEWSSLAADFYEAKLGEMKDTPAWQGKGQRNRTQQKAVQRGQHFCCHITCFRRWKCSVWVTENFAEGSSMQVTV